MKKEVKKVNNKEDAMLEAAYELFTEKGFAKTTISDITTHAGVAKGTFYLYFDSKYSLRHKLIAKKTADLYIEANMHIDENISSVDEKIIMLIKEIINLLCNNQPLLEFLSAYLNWGLAHETFARRMNQLDKNTIGGYTLLLKEGYEKYSNFGLMMFFIIELTSAACYNSVLNNEPVSIDELKPELERAVRGIMASFEKI